MNKQTIQITIPEPCHENWEAMTAVERGRFCGSCQKVVTDFTQMEDAEIIQFLKEGQGDCGRFSTAQLDRPLIPALEQPRYFIVPLYKKIAAGLLFFSAFSSTTFAQQMKAKTTQNEKKVNKPGQTKFIWLKGRLLNNNSDSVVENITVTLTVDSLKMITQTDTSGRFFFKIESKHKNKTAKVSTEKFHSVSEVVVLNKDNNEILLRCAPVLKISGAREDATIGLWISGHPDENLAPPKSKQSFWYRLTHPFKRSK